MKNLLKTGLLALTLSFLLTGCYTTLAPMRSVEVQIRNTPPHYDYYFSPYRYVYYPNYSRLYVDYRVTSYNYYRRNIVDTPKQAHRPLVYRSSYKVNNERVRTTRTRSATTRTRSTTPRTRVTTPRTETRSPQTRTTTPRTRTEPTKTRSSRTRGTTRTSTKRKSN
jgi:hypothetical protein